MRHIVVGVDGSRGSRRALAWAVDQARASGTTVQAVHVWSVPPLGADPLAQAMGGADALEAQARRELALVLDDTDEGGLVSPIERTLVRGEAIRALVDAALGSVTHGVICSAPCPVVVVPALDDERKP